MQKWKGGFQNFKDKKLIHNPNDGRMYVAELDDKGKVKEGPLGMVPMSTLVEVKNFNDQKIDVLAETNRYASAMKPFVEMVRVGKIETREQLENFKEFDDLVNNITEAIAKNEKGYASILTDTDGTYKITGEGASSGKNIGLKNNGAGEMIPIIDTDMKKRTRDVIKEFLIAQTGVKETGTAVFSPSRGTGGGTTKPPKYTPTVSDISRLNYKGTTNLKGVALGVDGVILSQGKGIEERVDALSYESGKLKMKVTKISGTETDEVTTGDETGGGTVKVGEGKKNIREKTDILNADEDYARMSLYIQKIPFPGQDRNFRSLKEAERYLKDAYAREKGSGGAQTTNTGKFDPEAYYNSQKKIKK